ncbi:MAG: putative Helicase, partial [Thermoleophilia bacterium]|nr:putative Helicase [Thermoleophilia bacterium]
MSTTSVYDVLNTLRAASIDERDKGDKFELLVKAFLEQSPEWQQRFTRVERWTEWEGRAGVTDIGIDLVAKNRDDDGWTAIQCKFYREHSTVSAGDIDSFLALSYRPDFNFTRRYIFDTAGRWSKNAEEKLQGQVQRIDVLLLDEAAFDWSRWSIETPDKIAFKGPKKLFPHQEEALEAVRNGLSDQDRGKLIMACGTGKTFTSLKIAEDLVGEGGTVLFLVPSIQLLSQTLREWMAQTEVKIRPFAVCSDVRVGRGDSASDRDQSTVDLPEPPTTDPTKLVARIGATAASDAMTVVFSTYQSIGVLTDAQEQGLGTFDLVICDEAHRTAGVVLADSEHSNFVKVHDNGLLSASKRIYMTATP